MARVRGEGRWARLRVRRFAWSVTPVRGCAVGVVRDDFVVGRCVGDPEGGAGVAVGVLVRDDVRLRGAKGVCAEGGRRAIAVLYSPICAKEVGLFSVSSSAAAGGGRTGRSGVGGEWFSGADAAFCRWRWTRSSQRRCSCSAWVHAST